MAFLNVSLIDETSDAESLMNLLYYPAMQRKDLACFTDFGFVILSISSTFPGSGLSCPSSTIKKFNSLKQNYVLARLIVRPISVRGFVTIVRISQCVSKFWDTTNSSSRYTNTRFLISAWITLSINLY